MVWKDITKAWTDITNRGSNTWTDITKTWTDITSVDGHHHRGVYRRPLTRRIGTDVLLGRSMSPALEGIALACG